MRVLVVTSTFPRWRGDTDPTFVYDLSIRLHNDTTEVHVLAPHAPGTQRTEVMDGVTVHRFRYFFEAGETLAYSTGILDKLRAAPLKYLLIPFFFAGMSIAVFRLQKRNRYDAIHAHWLIPQGLCAVVGSLLHRKRPAILCTSHGGDLFGLRGRFFNQLKRWIVNRCDATTVVSSYMGDVLMSDVRPQRRPTVLSMGVDLHHRFRPDDTVQRDDRELIFVGRLVEKKGVVHLIRALAILREQREFLTLTIVGDGPLRESLEREAAALSVESAVTFRGALTQDELPALYSRAAIAIVPSVIAKSGDQEGLGLVTVEAMGCGCAVVASDLAAIRDVIEDGHNGLLVLPENPQAIAAAIESLLGDPDNLLRYQRTARESVLSKFDWQPVSAGYRQILQSLVPDDA